MRGSRLLWRLLLPLVLGALVVLLGALQYRWLGQVSEAERAQLQRSLMQRANEFAAEFDRELGLALTSFQVDAGKVAAAPWPELGSRLDTWRGRAPFPALIKGVYLARARGITHTLARLSDDHSTGQEMEWPEGFAPIRDALGGTMPRADASARTTIFTLTMAPIIDKVPALIVPIVSRSTTEDGQRAMMEFRFIGTDYVVLELDREVLTQQMVPALVTRFFPGDDGNAYRVTVLNREGEVMFARGDQASDKDAADASATFFTGSRTDFVARNLPSQPTLAWETTLRRGTDIGPGAAAMIIAPTTTILRQSTSPAPTPSTGGTGPSGTTGAAVGGTRMQVFVQEHSGTAPAGMLSALPTRIALGSGGWRLVLRHQAGSLDVAVNNARKRNLATSFGILGVLVVGMGLVLVNARRAEKLASQQMEFVATVSHELRTPLAVIRSAAQNLSAGVVDDPAQARRYGDLIEVEGHRLTDMVEEVLEFSGVSGNRRPLSLRDVDVPALVQDVVSASRSLGEAQGVTMDVTIADDLPPVVADEDALRRAIRNLIGNALKYAADGGWIGVTVFTTNDASARHVQIAVRDRGPGIAAEDLPHLFEPFYRGRRAIDQQIHGNGLGLSLVSRIMQAHGGRVTVESTPGAGSTFTLVIPVAPVNA
jgi:signal transduction histidine kinase